MSPWPSHSPAAWGSEVLLPEVGPGPRLPLVLHEIFMHNRRIQRQHRPMGLCGGRFEGYLGSEITPRDVDRPESAIKEGNPVIRALPEDLQDSLDRSSP